MSERKKKKIDQQAISNAICKISLQLIFNV